MDTPYRNLLRNLKGLSHTKQRRWLVARHTDLIRFLIGESPGNRRMVSAQETCLQQPSAEILHQPLVDCGHFAKGVNSMLCHSINHIVKEGVDLADPVNGTRVNMSLNPNKNGPAAIQIPNYLQQTTSNNMSNLKCSLTPSTRERSRCMMPTGRVRRVTTQPKLKPCEHDSSYRLLGICLSCRDVRIAQAEAVARPRGQCAQWPQWLPRQTSA